MKASGAYHVKVRTSRQRIVETLAVGYYIQISNWLLMFIYIDHSAIDLIFPLAMIPLLVSIYGFL